MLRIIGVCAVAVVMAVTGCSSGNTRDAIQTALVSPNDMVRTAAVSLVTDDRNVLILEPDIRVLHHACPDSDGAYDTRFGENTQLYSHNWYFSANVFHIPEDIQRSSWRVIETLASTDKPLARDFNGSPEGAAKLDQIMADPVILERIDKTMPFEGRCD